MWLRFWLYKSQIDYIKDMITNNDSDDDDNS